MATIVSQAVSLSGHSHDETAHGTLLATAVSKEEYYNYSSGGSSSDHGKLMDKKAHDSGCYDRLWPLPYTKY